jgi:hypothetical protein
MLKINRCGGDYGVSGRSSLRHVVMVVALTAFALYGIGQASTRHGLNLRQPPMTILCKRYGISVV